MIWKQAAASLYTLTKHLPFHKPKKAQLRNIAQPLPKSYHFQEIAPLTAHHVERLIPRMWQDVTPSASSSQPNTHLPDHSKEIAPVIASPLPQVLSDTSSKVSGPCFGRFQLHLAFEWLVTCVSQAEVVVGMFSKRRAWIAGSMVSAPGHARTWPWLSCGVTLVSVEVLQPWCSQHPPSQVVLWC
jgi:hypothetical protein